MLTNTFRHLPGIGVKTESRLWDAGVHSWHDLLRQAEGRPARPVRASWADHLRESLRHHDARNPAYFFDRLPSDCHWRLFADYRGTCAFLDIETTGLSWSNAVTTIALYDGRRLRHYVNGHNLDAFVQDVRHYQLLVTYNGKSFDAPVLERFFGVALPRPHIDLRHVLHSLGLKGGLKACERRLGIERPGLEEVDGFTGVLLWQAYRRDGDRRALETLLAYNSADAVNLEALMVWAYNRKVSGTPFGSLHTLPPPTAPDVSFRPDRATVARVLREAGWGAFAAFPRPGTSGNPDRHVPRPDWAEG
jgi:uncharacterized protein YprB with RNaseH-like and TPR domain